ncbi:MAG: HU family DNA-binding protein [Leptospira sp.]|nr:HU family DNA-binding protein [Leptospira sp.]
MGTTKSEICKVVSLSKQIPFKIVEDSVNGFLENLKIEIASGNAIQLRGFGSFSRIKKKSRKVWDPALKIVKVSPEKFKISFKTGKEWTEMTSSFLNNNREGD